ncbi:MAG: hypothetical protein AMS25_00585 [Gemmatimonas sp. SM23_52]|nr:MAG: hypothetical protein AMS25_00585 [Gemmatimonas sp. SM23_52]
MPARSPSSAPPAPREVNQATPPTSGRADSRVAAEVQPDRRRHPGQPSAKRPRAGRVIGSAGRSGTVRARRSAPRSPPACLELFPRRAARQAPPGTVPLAYRVRRPESRSGQSASTRRSSPPARQRAAAPARRSRRSRRRARFRSAVGYELPDSRVDHRVPCRKQAPHRLPLARPILPSRSTCAPGRARNARCQRLAAPKWPVLI